MHDIQLEIASLTSGPSQKNSYTLLLSDLKSGKKLPIVIGAFEAQAIALVMEEITPQRPLTHDLFKNFADAYKIKVKAIHITNLVEGVFFSHLICEQNGELTEMDARTSDAIAMALRFKCPIYTSSAILEMAGIDLEKEEESEQAEHVSQSDELSPFQPQNSELNMLSEEELNEQLQSAIDNEDYDLAAEIRDELKSRK